MKLKASKSLLLLFFILLQVGCKNASEEDRYTSEEIEQETAKLNDFFEREFQKDLADSPMLQTRLGIKENYDSWDDFSHVRYSEDLEIGKRKIRII